MRQARIALLVTLFTVLAAAKEDYVLRDLIAEETSPVDNRRVIHNTGDEESIKSAANSLRSAQARKITRQSEPEDIIRDIQRINNRLTEEKPSLPDTTTRDKGNKDDDDDEDKKTLSQQVADGKYGLIQRELFDPPAERPGILSYEVNPEVPRDNINNLGGLQPEEIWLAENHLLVLSGGGFPEKHKTTKSVWPPIDNYVAPMRQVKIPPNPKVPPPFPVQLKPGGPTEFIKNENGTGGPPPFPPFFAPPFLSNSSIPNDNGFPYPPPDYVQGNFSQGNGPFNPPLPFPFIPPPGLFPGFPPGAAFLPPPGNFTDLYDEDDPSIYYPPPYDFYFPKDNSSSVPPGPLVPGIVLPPPPDFFAPLTNKTTSKTRRPSTTRYQSKSKATRKPTKKPTTTVKPPASISYYDTFNQVTTPNPLYSTTIRPTESPNEITPPPLQHVLPANAIVQGWVPIPAPKPFFITGPRKPLQKFTTTTLPPEYNSVTPPEDQNGYIYDVPQQQYQLPQDGWIYPNDSRSYKHQYLDYFDYYPENKKEQYFSPVAPQSFNRDKVRTVLIQKSKEVLASALPPSKPYPAEGQPNGKAVKTYYYYEEPQISQAHVQDAEDYKLDHALYKTTSPSPRQLFESHTQKSKILENQARSKFQPSPIDYFFSEDLYRHISPTTTRSPVRYYYVPKDYQEHKYPVSTPESSTAKPPVYEYSFSAPGYGSIDPPKIGVTPKPNANRELYDYQYYDYNQAPRAPKQTYLDSPVFTTPRPDYISNKPQVNYYNGAILNDGRLNPVQTENPYHAFFTHHDAGLIDDITKKYFSTFGQKINKESLQGEPLTTPLPAPLKTAYPQTTPQPGNQIKFPDDGFYITTPAPQLQYNRPTYKYDSKLSALTSARKPISLEKDTLVNYRQPLPAYNPDAEYVNVNDPRKPQLIQYRLPGDGGGQYYFYTPQALRPQGYRQTDDYYYPAQHYKRRSSDT